MTHPSTTRELQTLLFSDAPSPHERAGFELGWDHARHGVAPPPAYLGEPSALRSGWVAGQAAIGARTLVAGRYARQWLQLRLHAWLRGRSVEPVQVTPNYLQQIDTGHCPITRVALAGPPDAAANATAGDAQPASIDRVRDDAAYAAGNLAVMSRRANHAKGAKGRAAAAELARRLAAEPPGAQVEGLGASEWARVATLCSFVEALPHATACTLPMRVLPPNRLRLFNPVQALQAFLSRQFLRAGWSRRFADFESMLPDDGCRRAFRGFFLALLPRVIEAGRAEPPAAAAWAIEDAWGDPRVQRRWEGFALRLDAARCLELLSGAAARRLVTGALMPLTAAGATDGWALDTRGYLPPIDASRAIPAAEPAPATSGPVAPPQRQLVGWQR